jgi:hypothetical protein
VQFALPVHPVVGSVAVQVDLGGYVDLAEMLDELFVLGADRGFDRVGGAAAVIQRSGLSVARRYEQRNALELGSQVVGVVLPPGCGVGVRVTPQREWVCRSLGRDEAKVALGHVAGEAGVNDAAERRAAV